MRNEHFERDEFKITAPTPVENFKVTPDVQTPGEHTEIFRQS